MENSLSQQIIQKLSPAQQRLIDVFLEHPNDFKSKALRTSLREHQDGTIERWQIQLESDFYVYIDGSSPKPWSSSDSDFMCA